MTTPATLGTAPIRTTPGAGGGAVTPPSLPDVEQLLWVDQSTSAAPDGTRQHPYHSLEDAITAANALTPAADNRVLIVILPGVYVEATPAMPVLDGYVYLAGTDRDSCIIQSSTSVLNIDNAPFEAWNLTFLGDGGTVPLIDIDAAGEPTCEFHECRIVTTNDHDCISISSGAYVWFVDCDISSGDEETIVFYLLGAVTETHIVDCRVEGLVQISDGDLYCSGMEMSGSIYSSSQKLFGLQGSSIVSTTTSCVYFGLETNDGSRILEDNWLSSPVDEYEVSGQVWAGGETPPAPVVVYVHNNVMQRGFYQLIAPSILERLVGQAGDRDFHATLYDACTSAVDAGTAVYLLKDVSFDDTLEVPDTVAVIDCNGYSITTTDDTYVLYFDTKAKQCVKDGTVNGWVQVGDTAENVLDVTLLRCVVNGTIFVDDGAEGSKFRIDQCQVLAAEEDDYALVLADIYVATTVVHSYLRGFSPGEGSQEAVLYDTVTNDLLSIRHSTVAHGGAATSPFQRNNAQTPTMKGHHNGYSADPFTAWLANSVAVGQRFDTLDVDVAF